MKDNSVYILEEESVFERGYGETTVSHRCAYESSEEAFEYVTRLIKDDGYVAKNVTWDIDFGNVKCDKVTIVGNGYFRSTFDDDEGKFIEGTMTITITKMLYRRAKKHGLD